MSKKCCGIIYSDKEAVCKVCGKSLEDAETVADEDVIEDNEQTDEDVEKITEQKKESKAEEKAEEVKKPAFVFDDDDEDENKASTGHKVFGIISVLLALTVFALIGLGAYYFIVAPFYDKKPLDTTPVYPALSTATDASVSGIREPVPYTEISTATDAVVSDETTKEDSAVDDSEIATIGDATEPVMEENTDENVEE